MKPQEFIPRILQVIVVFTFLLSFAHAAESSTPICTVVKVIDGDTLKVKCPSKPEDTIRLIGVDTPETKHPNKPVQFYGKEASAFTKRMADGKKVRLEFAPANTTQGHRGVYGRLLAYVFIQQLDGGWFDLNAELIKQGYAHVYTSFPFNRLDEFRRLEREAREAERGLWAESAKPLAQPDPQLTGKCQIKGNISQGGKKIYHVLGGRWYKRTKIDESKGERWFCTEEEAVQAGWRKSSQ